MYHCSPGRARLQGLDYRVRVVPLGSLNRSGGAACCLTLPLHHRFKGANETVRLAA